MNYLNSFYCEFNHSENSLSSETKSPKGIESVSNLLKSGHQCYITSQVLIEFWVVATRPMEVINKDILFLTWVMMPDSVKLRND